MPDRNKLIQGRERVLIFAHGRKRDSFCYITPTPGPKIESKIKDLLPFLYVWIKKELHNQDALLSRTRMCARIEKLAETITEYHFLATESLRLPQRNGVQDSFQTTFESELREEAISYANSEDELFLMNTLCIQAIPWNYFSPRFLTLSPEELRAIERSLIQTHDGELFPFTTERNTA